jgi:hypothetical protein
MTKLIYPFEVAYDIIASNPDPYIDAVFESLQSTFVVLPKGDRFIPYREFASAYETLKRHTQGFAAFNPPLVMNALRENALAFVVLRTILGFSPPELAYATSNTEGDVPIPQRAARDIDRKVRDNSEAINSFSSLSLQRIEAMVETACRLINRGSIETPDAMIHRLDKADTQQGIQSLRHVVNAGVPYAMLLYERFLGRPFASHRDSVSRIVGNVMEDAVETELRKANVSFRRTQYAEAIEGFDQAPDFIIPDEWNQQFVIEAKMAEDDGTARDKVTRIQHLAEISRQRKTEGEQSFQVIACVDGRGFSIRREDMRKLLEATQGKVFTLETLDALIPNTRLKEFAA